MRLSAVVLKLMSSMYAHERDGLGSVCIRRIRVV
jgi:hypothetical protein